VRFREKNMNFGEPRDRVFGKWLVPFEERFMVYEIW